ncbi:MAG: sulfite exporter TauE/SafE family protein [Pseudomonadota bacterium]
MMPELSPLSLFVIFAALSLGGILKGATGAGTPIVAVPVMAAFFDVRLAVIIMATPNLITNLWQVYQYRQYRLPEHFARNFAVAGAIGAILGTAMLALLPVRFLSLLLACAVFAYVGLRIASPTFRLEFDRAKKLVLPMGIGGGILQGAAGISAPIAVSFLNAMRLERPVFIVTVSTFFSAMSVGQLPALYAYGLLNAQLLALSAASLIPMLGALPLGAFIAKRMSPKVFDLTILALLTALGFRLVYTALI